MRRCFQIGSLIHFLLLLQFQMIPLVLMQYPVMLDGYFLTVTLYMLYKVFILCHT